MGLVSTADLRRSVLGNISSDLCLSFLDSCNHSHTFDGPQNNNIRDDPFSFIISYPS